MSTSKEVMETWFHRVWTEEDTSAIEEMFMGLLKYVRTAGIASAIHI